MREQPPRKRAKPAVPAAVEPPKRAAQTKTCPNPACQKVQSTGNMTCPGCDHTFFKRQSKVNPKPRVTPPRPPSDEEAAEDLRRQCAAQNDAYVRCLSEGGAENCLTEKHELEQCATWHVQLVSAINSSCGEQYAQFQACFKRASDRQIANPDCDRPSAAFWECAQVQIQGRS